MPTNPDPTPQPPPGPLIINVAGTTAQEVSNLGGLPTKLNHLRESINEMQQLLAEITDELNRSGNQSK